MILHNPPRLTEVEAHRKPGWLELFYDLVFVATVVQLSNKLSGDISVNGFVEYALLFIPIWWVWLGTTLYFNRFDVDDAVHRLLIFGQIFMISALAVLVYDGFGETSAAFALCYAVARLVLVVLYLRSAYFIPQARALSHRYAVGFAIAAILWLISALVPPPFRFILWLISLVIDFATPLSPASRRLQRDLPPNIHHLPERMGLFTIIVFGESFLKVIGAYGDHTLTTTLILWGFLGLILVGSLWWLYFENIADHAIRWKGWRAQTWLYVHLPLQLALPALAVGIYKLVTSDPDHGGFKPEYRLLMAGSIALALIAIEIIEAMVTHERPHNVDFALRAFGVVAALVIGVLATTIDATLFVLLLVGVCLIQVVYDVFHEAREETAGVGVHQDAGHGAAH